MKSCAEAKFYLTQCGVTRLDRDKDGIPCETICRENTNNLINLLILYDTIKKFIQGVKMKKTFLVILGLGVLASLFAHSGRTDSAGCHTDHKTGVYHCH